ncbi:GNAT family N-acetyltransferase [Acidovorax sp. Leaf78]|uniref:GNAT family N-acetyltransferase n=1 Tax=unclassified Acidovorax TaxID=2684926 RepID=UPI001F29B40A|nr:GNAT family N-acetyltransferase [Acidovorax sp. Leaf78]
MIAIRCDYSAMKISLPQIRPAAVTDVSAMFKVRASVGENTMTPAELSAIGITPEAIAFAVESAQCAWVATVDEEVVGFAMVDLDSACLFALFVLPEYEGRGIGTSLTKTCELALFEQHSTAWLETANGSRAAQLYRHLGWGNESEIGGGDIRLEKQRA